jgi:hypothetical protein
VRETVARILPTEHHLASQEGRNGYATHQGMYGHNLYSFRYLCTFSYSKNNSKFTGSLLKIYVCDVNKNLLRRGVAPINSIGKKNIPSLEFFYLMQKHEFLYIKR